MSTEPFEAPRPPSAEPTAHVGPDAHLEDAHLTGDAPPKLWRLALGALGPLVRRHLSSGVLGKIGWAIAIPALLCRMSRRPKCAVIAAIIVSTAVRFVTSAATSSAAPCAPDRFPA